MIELIKIKNLALVEKAEIEFGSGFNVLTGETGAGKTVIMKALALLLGERAERNIIRTGESKCEISALFNLKNKKAETAISFINDAGIELDTEHDVIIRRTITKSSSRNFINDTPVTLSTLRELGDMLIDIHGSYEHQSLLDCSKQLSMVDAFGKHKNLKLEVAKAWKNHIHVQGELLELQKGLPTPIEAEHLKAIVQDITEAAILKDEDMIINERHKVLSNAKEILETTSATVSLLNESDNCVTNLLVEVRHFLTALEKLELSNIKDYLSRCDDIMNAIRELAFDLDSFSSQIEIDESAFFEIENRLNIIQSLKRKYGPTIEDIVNTKYEAHSKLEKLDNFEYLMDGLKVKKDKTFKEFTSLAEELSVQRKQTAKILNMKIVETLKSLGFENAKFFVKFDTVQASLDGIDFVEFMFSANKGEEIHSLKNVASSGEISRVMLALKTVIADADSIPILVFDEIDVNIGGETAVVVGEKLRNLSKSHQLLCISHLPVVAACAHRHYKVEKYIQGNRTVSNIVLLNKEGRVKEITRMLGGGNAAAKHAKKLLSEFLIRGKSR